MKYFTPERYLALQDFRSDEAMDAAGAAWEATAQRYRHQLKRLLPSLPKGLHSLVSDFYCHDATVLSLGRAEQTFVMVLRLEVPPQELLVVTYRLTEEAVIKSHAFPAERSAGPVQWMYDEVGAVPGKSGCWSHSILLSNGWEVQLRLSDVGVVRAETVYPGPETMPGQVATAAISRPA
jgi:hypothetical protein